MSTEESAKALSTACDLCCLALVVEMLVSTSAGCDSSFISVVTVLLDEFAFEFVFDGLLERCDSSVAVVGVLGYVEAAAEISPECLIGLGMTGCVSTIDCHKHAAHSRGVYCE